MDQMTTRFLPRLNNGNFGLWVDPSGTIPEESLFTKYWQQGALLNPVIGLRIDPLKPRLTVGALDPEDYEGEINWVELETTSPKSLHTIKVDGIKGYNGSFIPFGVSGLTASLNSRTYWKITL